MVYQSPNKSELENTPFDYMKRKYVRQLWISCFALVTGTNNTSDDKLHTNPEEKENVVNPALGGLGVLMGCYSDSDNSDVGEPDPPVVVEQRPSAEPKTAPLLISEDRQVL